MLDMFSYILGMKKGGGGGVINIQNPSELQQLIAAGKARDILSIGDSILIPWTDNSGSTPITYQYPFVVAHIGDCYDENDAKHENAVYLMAQYATPYDMQFDAAEATDVDLETETVAVEGWYYWGITGTTYTALNLSTGDTIPTTYDSVTKCGINNVDVLKYGYNRWKDSAYRQWLNSDAAKNANWWTSQHFGDVSPTATYTDKPGWLNGFNSDWSAVFKKVKVQTACNTVTDGGVTDTTYDKFFLPSLEQMYGSPQVADVEGEYWEYWKNVTGLDSPTNGDSSHTNDARKIRSVNSMGGSAAYCRMRSATRGYAYSVWLVSSGGYFSFSTAVTAYRALPACVIF